MFRVLNKVFDNNQRDVQRIIKTVVDPVNALEQETMQIEDLAAAFLDLRRRVQEGGESLDDVLVPAFALIREAGRRSIGKRHYDVQLIGGAALHQGRIAEMRTGEGKTLVATLALSLNALEGRGCHLVTVNDYLARVGMEEMGLLYRTLGLTVGLASREMQPHEKQAAYACDITYVTNSELGFDYLRDNMAQSREALAMRAEHPLNYAIVDEVDSILIDEARTPLIISGAAEKATDLYYVYAKLIRRLQKGEPAEPGVRAEPTGDYTIDEKGKQVHITEAGISKIERLLSIPDLYSPENMDKAHMITQAIRAKELYHREKDYIINADGEVIIIDEFTGRSMPGRRYGEGLHQAIEAKENVKIENENQTLATITYQNFFRLYNKFAGMTGTAKTEEKEFLDIYGSDVLVIPTNRTILRKDSEDLVYRTKMGKYAAVVQEVAEMHATGRPVLIGTASIVTSEQLSDLLTQAGIRHSVLNAKFEAQEASIVAQAGRSGTVTIATNMAGRGTDIMLGGNAEFILGESIEQHLGISRFAPEAENFIKAISRQDPAAEMLGMQIPGMTPEFIQQAQQLQADTVADRARVQELGGLHIIGTERHESRRIDNQLRGRAGRQGDPGSSRFYVSFEDDLMRLFANDRVVAMMDRLGMDDSQPIEAKMVTGAIEKAQARVEDRNFSTRKQLLEFDNVMSKQRDTIYAQRREVLLGPDEDVEESTEGMIADFVDMQLAIHAPADQSPDAWDIEGLQAAIVDAVPQLEGFDFESLRHGSPAQAQDRLLSAVADAFDSRREELGSTMLNSLARYVLLQVVDQHWKEHLHGMDVLRQGIGLRGYGQRDPFTEYKFEATNMFNEMIDNLKSDVTKFIFRMQFGQTG
ncbi:preprotein translocase subunit SecA [Deinococcus deserti]|uniref:Protein translocase subunit SecA n=1 Tax=Deinococcus deserti (strain DSM 17065 / CIP 109153 / LMG 22923 / VCD115) TaxID=546414 RepID=SECA_DEIDV|nr:preprotein translocase subunit SecA [Deinococcus deserti]C1CWX4.1 RecName: Full=Protein translocase subunit SecA [Deinococcus deserti VCD115]ACO46691.1 putative Preprotein translocase secA subunit [Deinococcus deserti VCD115]